MYKDGQQVKSYVLKLNLFSTGKLVFCKRKGKHNDESYVLLTVKQPNTIHVFSRFSFNGACLLTILPGPVLVFRCSVLVLEGLLLVLGSLVLVFILEGQVLVLIYQRSSLGVGRSGCDLDLGMSSVGL